MLSLSPSSIDVKDKSVELRALGLQGRHDAIVKVVEGIDVLLSAIAASQQLEQIPLAKLARLAE